MRETKFQSALVDELREMFPGCLILRNDPTYIQGVPDLLILYMRKWAALECKKGKSAAKRPNQDYYIDLMNKMSFAAFISPENRKEVLYELQQALQT